MPPESFRTTTRRRCLVPRRSRRLWGEKPLGAERIVAFLSVLVCLLFLLVLVDEEQGKEEEMVVVRVSIVVVCIERR
mgnify:CR=1 FL=1